MSFLRTCVLMATALMTGLAAFMSEAAAQDLSLQPVQYSSPATSACPNAQTLRIRRINPGNDTVTLGQAVKCGTTGTIRLYEATSSGAPDLSRELMMIDNMRTNETIIIDMVPGEWRALPLGSTVSKYLETSFITSPSIPKRTWQSLSLTLPFVPSAVYDSGSGFGMLGGLRVIPELAYDFSGMTYQSKIIAINGLGFYNPSDLFTMIDHGNTRLNRLAFIIYMNKGDPTGQIRVKMARLTPVSQVAASFARLTADPHVAAIQDNAVGQQRLALLGLLSGLSAAYDFYNASGMAEADRQACAEWKSRGGSPLERPLRSC